MKTAKMEINVRALISLRGCGDTLPFFKLSLKSVYDGSERAFFMKRALQLIVEKMESGISKNKLYGIIKGFFEEQYEESFFDFKVQYDAGKEKDLTKLVRMVDYLYDNGYTVVHGRTEYRVLIDQVYRGNHLESIHDFADMILQTPEGNHMAVLFSLGEPGYSYRAKKEANMVENSIELISLYQGLCGKYGENLETAVFYLKNKDDKGDGLVEKFDHKSGKNIIRWSFQTPKEGWQKLNHAVSLRADVDCGRCWYRSICKTQRFLSCEAAAPSVANKIVERKPPKLTKEQTQVVEHINGPMCVVAVPGAGKTFSLVTRLEYMIKTVGIDAGNILFVTFTQKAAAEIRERIGAALDKNTIQPEVFTFNALGYSLLKEHPEASGGAFRLAGKVDRLHLMEQALMHVPKIMSVSYDGITGEYGLLNILEKDFSFIEKNGKDSYRLKYGANRDLDGVLTAYEEYRSLFTAGGYISYDDQICLANKLLEARPDVLEECQKKFRYVMVDEFQDVSQPQVDLIYRIAGHGNLVVVGDDDQNIYSWRGGSSRFMLNFNKDWSEAIRITMADNFRSVSTVLEAANPIITKNTERFLKDIQPHMFTVKKPVYLKDIVADDVSEVIQGILRDGYQAGDIAVIARKNSELAGIAVALRPYVKVLPSRQYLIDDAVFIAVYDVLAMYYKGFDDFSLYRFLKLMSAEGEIPDKRDKKRSLYENLCQDGKLLIINHTEITCLPEYESRKDESRLFHAGHILITMFKALQYSKSVPDAIGKIFRLMFHEKKHVTLDALESICEERLITTTQELFSFMTAMVRYHDETELEYPRRDDMVNLLTAHKSKGKEYPVVIVYNVESYRDVPEDRCLLYVAMTRAKQMLYMTNGPWVRGELVSDFIGCVDTMTALAIG